MTQHAPLVKRLAYHLIGRLPASVSVEDLIQAGMLGLLDAARHYDQGQGASFETYASIRIRGAMIDELRRNDWAPKSVHRRMRELSEAIQTVEHQNGRPASDQEIADQLEVSLEEYHQLLHEASTSQLMTFEDAGIDQNTLGELAGEPTYHPDTEFQEDRFRKSLAAAIGRLPEREQLVMALYYDRDLNLKEIGAILSVSESRVSQLLSQTHARLRARLQDWT